MSFILSQGKEIVFKVSDLFISNKSFMILIKVVMKHLRIFLSRRIGYQNLEDLHYTLY